MSPGSWPARWPPLQASTTWVVQAGARRPDGDAVQFDVRDEAANPVLGALRDMGLDRAG